jgi:hypothetical protein
MINTLRGTLLAALVATLAFGTSLTGTAQAAEHPAHNAPGVVEDPANTADLSAGIKDYVESTTKLSGGKFTFYDGVDKKPLALTLVRIHDDKISYLNRESGTAFFCADFKNEDGEMYDLDFIMTAKDKELEPVEVLLHKHEGVERYAWVETDGVWSRNTKNQN